MQVYSNVLTSQPLKTLVPNLHRIPETSFLGVIVPLAPGGQSSAKPALHPVVTLDPYTARFPAACSEGTTHDPRGLGGLGFQWSTLKFQKKFTRGCTKRKERLKWPSDIHRGTQSPSLL